MTAFAALTAPYCHAVTIVSAPIFTPAGTNAPLAGTLSVATDVNSFVSVSVDDGVKTWNRDFFDYGTNHSEIVLGFKPNRTNQITVTVRDIGRNSYVYPGFLSFITGALPSKVPNIIVVTNNTALMEPGYTLFRGLNVTANVGYIMMVDASGEVAWYSGTVLTPSDVRQLTNGNLFFPNVNTAGFTEANMLGKTVQTWSAAPGYPVDSHEDLITDHGTILYLSYAKQLVEDFPSSATNPNAPTETADVSYDRVVEISATNSSLLNAWSLLAMLDPTRIDYLCFLDLSFYGIDPEHANAIIDDTNDNSIIASLRNQDAIIKFSRAGQLQWILGPTNNWGPEWQPYLLTPVGTPFAWNYAQHAPILTPQGTLLFFDDGNCRAEPWATPLPDAENYSRAAEFSVDEANMTVSQVWEFSGTNTDRIYADALGNTTVLPQTGNVLITFGAVTYENGRSVAPLSSNGPTMVRLKEVTHTADPTVVFDLELFDPGNTNGNYSGYEVYRSYRVSDLYGHPATPVPELSVQMQLGGPLLQFTADPMLSYIVQASADLVNWSDVGTPEPDDADGDYSFIDEGSGLAARYYRVVTQ